MATKPPTRWESCHIQPPPAQRDAGAFDLLVLLLDLLGIRLRIGIQPALTWPRRGQVKSPLPMGNPMEKTVENPKQKSGFG